MAVIEFPINVYVKGDDIEDKFNRLFNEATMLELHNLLAKMCDPYVPFLEGPLSQTVQVTPECVRYIQPYARYQYYGTNFNHTLDYHPQASAMWDRVMISEHKEEFEEGVREILRRRIHDEFG